MTDSVSSSTPSARATSTSHVRVTELASGGMGKVELALRREGGFRRLYAIKRLHRHLTDDADFRAMFLDEARVAGLIQHPNVVSVLDVGEDEEGPFLLMDFVDGLPLSELVTLSVKSEQPLPVQTCVRIAIAMARGLHAAHELRDHEGRALELVHRDLSPQNVLVGWDGSVRITDFGIAKALGKSSKTATGVVKGKMSYMAPEQLRFEETDRRADLFALGVVVFEMLAGRRLYKNVEGSDGIRRILNEPPPDIGEERPEVPASLVALLFALLAKSPEKRPASAAVVVQRLEGVLADLLADEPPLETVTVVEELAGGVRAEREEKLREEIAAAERREAASIAERLARRAPPRRRTALWLAAVGVVSSATLAVGAWWITQEHAETNETAESAEPPPTMASPAETASAARDRASSASATSTASTGGAAPGLVDANAPAATQVGTEEAPAAVDATEAEAGAAETTGMDAEVRATPMRRRRVRRAPSTPMGAEPVSMEGGRQWDAWE